MNSKFIKVFTVGAITIGAVATVYAQPVDIGKREYDVGRGLNASVLFFSSI